MSLMRCTIVLVIVAVAMAANETVSQGEKPKRCCMPRTYFLNAGGVETYAGNTTHGLSGINGEYAMKSRRKMAAVRVFNLTNQETMRIVMDYRKHVLYNISGSSCVRTRFLAPFPDQCLPESAQYVADFRFGGDRQTLDIDYWENKIPQAGRFDGYTFTKNCYPVSGMIIIADGKVQSVISYGLSNMEKKIKSPAIFDIPQSCKSQAVLETPAAHLQKKEFIPVSFISQFMKFYHP